MSEEIEVLVSANNEWITVNKYGIEKIRIKTGGVIYKFRIEVVCATGVYSFEDASGDVYKLTCYQAGDHYVDYNSGHPNIVKIRRLNE